MPWRHMSGEDSAQHREGQRERAFGQDYKPTIVDRFGVWLSARQIRRHAGTLAAKTLGDFGCGFNATFVRTVLPELKQAILVDTALAPDLRNTTCNCDWACQVRSGRSNQQRDGPLHLSDQDRNGLRHCRIAKPGRVCMFNVPSWRGRRFWTVGLPPRPEPKRRDGRHRTTMT